MVREYKWRLPVRSYEADAWGFVPTSGIQRYLEWSAVIAALDAGYGRGFHEEHGSAWVIRRMTLLMYAPARQHSELEITTWAARFGRVRGDREYAVRDAASGQTLYTGLAEWVYIDRQKLTPLAIPAHLTADFDVPGAPLQRYDPPDAPPSTDQRQFVVERTVEWHELDSMGHVNNAMYLDWLDDALRAGLESTGLSMLDLREKGLHLRGEYYNLNYKRAALPGERVLVATTIDGSSDRLLSVQQTASTQEGDELITVSSIYGWRDVDGAPAVVEGLNV